MNWTEFAHIMMVSLAQNLISVTYEGHPKSFRPRHIRQWYFPQSVHQWNVHFYWLIWVCCGYDIIVIYDVTENWIETIFSVNKRGLSYSS